MISNITAKTRIGLIDDDFSVRRAIDRLLRTHGYYCATYESAEAALIDPAFLQMNCIVVDIQLGGMNGFQFRNRLDALEVHIPCVFITAHIESVSADLGNSALLLKPFEESQLIASIESSIGTAGSDR